MVAGGAAEALTSLSHDQLAVLGREYLLAGHLQDRASMPWLILHHDRETMTQVAIEEWMAASPIYTRRMQRALGFAGDDIPTIFKGLQLDVGAPHQFMDFRFEVSGPDEGRFWLDHCGALMDVEPMGSEFVVAMCHDIEDPTFDATAVATNPLARVRPVHRPPRQPADRQPHCEWRVFLDHDGSPIEVSDGCRVVGDSVAATIEIPAFEGTDTTNGLNAYEQFDPDFQLEHLSTAALLAACEEFCLQGHLLVRGLLLAVASRFGEDQAQEVNRFQLRGIGPVVAARLRDALGLGQGAEAVAEVLRLHPVFRPTAYVATDIDVLGDRVRVGVLDSPVFGEDHDHTWLHALCTDATILEAIAQGVDPRARASATSATVGEVVAWEITVDPDAEPATIPDEVHLARVSTGADFELRKPLPVASS
ncbi:MAG: hypothetical protein R3249_07705 [Nitriliruptorales bacterium]|nr:hypothetical protein [Nitriliruptorales bacterium]